MLRRFSCPLTALLARPRLLLLLAVLALLPAMTATDAAALEKNLHIEWSYDTSLPGLAGYKIYQDGNLVQTVANPALLATDVTITITADTNFTMTAFDSENLESPQSAPYLIRYSEINAAPQAAPINITLNEDASHSGTLTASDADNDALTYSIAGQPAHGALTLVNPQTGAFTYTPEANFNGADSFVFKASDSWAESNVATVTLTVVPVNDDPISSDISLAIDEDTQATGTLAGADADGDTLTFAIITSPARGQLSLDAATGNFTYTPAADYSGTDSFTFKVNDGTADSAPATATIAVREVNDPPVAAVIDPGKAAPGAAVTLDGSSSTDPDDGIASVVWKQIAGPTVQLGAANTLTPTFTAPATGPRGTPLVFEITITDKGGLASTGTASVTVNWPLPTPEIRILTAAR
ncbi:MAG: Ig-like domain-containing protein [Thermodesulfobacteriota bacterium]